MVNPLDRSVRASVDGIPIGQDELGRTIYSGPMGEWTEPLEAPEVDRITGIEKAQSLWDDFSQWVREDENKFDTLTSLARDAVVNTAQGTWDAVSSATNPDASLGDVVGAAGVAMAGGLPMKAPEGSLRVFAGRNAKTVDTRMNDRAERMLENGSTPQEIWEETGFQFDEANQRWQFEIDPEDTKINFDSQLLKEPELTDNERWDAFKEAVSSMVLEDDMEKIEFPFVDLIKSPQLFEAYPVFKDARIVIDNETNALGSFSVRKEWRSGEDPDPDDPLSQTPLEQVEVPVITINTDLLWDMDRFYETLQHELQHGVQAIEGWDGGSNTSYVSKHMSDTIDREYDKRLSAWKDSQEEISNLHQELALLDENFDSVDPEEQKRYEKRGEELNKEIERIEQSAPFPDRERIAFQLYKENVGETEARAAASRLQMTHNERLETKPSDSKRFELTRKPPVRSPGISMSLPVEYPRELRGE